MKNNKLHLKKGTLASAIGIVCNVLLAVSKLAVGLMFGLVSVVADGFNNLSDCGSSVVTLVAFRISEKPADKEHPYGHRRVEYIASLVTGFFVLFFAVGLVRESIDKIISKVLPETSWIVYLVLAISVAVKAAMFVFYRIVARNLQSDSLKAAATDSLCDCIATTAVIVGVLVLQFTDFPADGWIGILVALFVLWQGVKIVKDASSKLLGQAPNADLLDKIKAVICSKDGIIGIHDLRIYSYGNDMFFSTVHVEMDANIPSLQAHAVLDEIEHEVKDTLNVALTAHFDPVDLQDREALELEASVREAIENVQQDFGLHDFRLVRGVRNKLIFDVEVPYSCNKSDEMLRCDLERAVRGIVDYEVLITIERK
ncbi:MAG: cation transporter [Clostridiales bacterium]|nr:cation transporter [Clostridiales bacterium]